MLCGALTMECCQAGSYERRKAFRFARCPEWLSSALSDRSTDALDTSRGLGQRAILSSFPALKRALEGSGVAGFVEMYIVRTESVRKGYHSRPWSSRKSLTDGISSAKKHVI